MRRDFDDQVQAARALALAMRDQLDTGLQGGGPPTEAMVRSHITLASILRDLAEAARDHATLPERRSSAELDAAMDALRTRLDAVTDAVDGLPDSADQRALLLILQTLRATHLTDASLADWRKGVDLQAHGHQVRTAMLDDLSALQATLVDLTARQERLVLGHSAWLSQITRQFYGLLIAVSLGVFLVTAVIWYAVLERRVARRLSRLHANLAALKAGEPGPLVLDGAGDELSQFNDALNDLRHEILERDRLEADLRRAGAEALRSAEAKSQFLSTMSHEVKTPLNAIIGMFELIETSDVPDRQKQRAASGRKAGEKLLSLLTNVLDASRIENASLRIEWHAVDSTELREEITAMLEGAASRRGPEVRWSLSWDEAVPPVLRLDSYRVRQILHNLIDNAFKFTDHGAITVEVGMRAGRRSRLLVSVKDTGRGVPEAMLDRIFEPFQQVQRGRDRRHGGSGLGLSISRSLAGLMGGTLTVRSRHGHGSEFRLTLPVGSPDDLVARSDLPATRAAPRAVQPEAR